VFAAATPGASLRRFGLPLLAPWISLRANEDQMAASARIPLEDEIDRG